MNKTRTTVYHADILLSLTGRISRLLALIFLAAGSNCFALPMMNIPAPMQTTNPEPQMRTISLKLPLRQVQYHWTFMNRKELLAGKLVLRVMRSDKTNEIVVFESGRMSEGWEAIKLSVTNAGEIYFGFKSSKKYATAPSDRLELELLVKQDLNGIGPDQRGILPAGSYKAWGTYSWLLDKFKVPDDLKSEPEETINKLRETYDFAAFLENWQDQWDLRITGEDGWQQNKQMLEKTLKKDGATEK